MKNQTVLRVPSSEDMAKHGYKLVGSVLKSALLSSVDSDLPYMGWFFSPVSKVKVLAWVRV